MTDERNKITDTLDRLLDSAYRDTGGSRRAAQFLLSLWNGDQFKADLQELLYVDKQHFEDMQMFFQALYDQNAQLDTFVSENQMVPIIERWGQTFSKRV